MDSSEPKVDFGFEKVAPGGQAAVFTSFMDAVHAFYTQAEIAGAIAHRSPDGNLSPRDTEELIAATSETQGKLAYAAKFLSYASIGLQKTAH